MVMRFEKKIKGEVVCEWSFEMRFRRGYNAKKIEADLKKEARYKEKLSAKEKKNEEKEERNFEKFMDNIDNFNLKNMTFKDYEK